MKTSRTNLKVLAAAALSLSLIPLSTAVAAGRVNPVQEWAPGDYNHDGRVDLVDLGRFMTDWNSAVAALVANYAAKQSPSLSDALAFQSAISALQQQHDSFMVAWASSYIK